MKIAMVCPASPHGVVGGAERYWEGLVDALNAETEHEATLVKVTSAESNLAELVTSYVTFDAAVLDEFDMVISGKYPAWMVRHRNHIVHMSHTLRGLYDTYDPNAPRSARPESPQGRELVHALRTLAPGSDTERRVVLSLATQLIANVPAEHPDMRFPGPLARELVHWLDADALDPRRIRRHYAISHTVANRDGYFPPGVKVEVAIHPTGLGGLRPGPYRSIFTASRLDGPKRIGLIVEAMQFVTGPCELRIAGTGPLERELRERAYHDDRITFLGRIDDAQLADEYANALVVPFVPYEEDLGLITLEAQLSGKPVVTCRDSGGVVEMVSDHSDGFVVDPHPEAIGAALSKFVLDRSLAERMGQRGRARAREITWRRLIRQLLTERPPKAAPAKRPQVVFFNTYAAEPARHGGQVRANRLLRSLSNHYDVHYIAVTERQLGKTGYIFPSVWQTIIEPSTRSREIEAAIAPPAGVPVGDLAALLAAGESPDLRELADAAMRHASAVVLTHPYLYPLIRDLDREMPIIYDSQNAEWSLKRSVFPRSQVGAALAAAVAEAEAATMRRAQLVTAVSDDDVEALRELTATMAEFVVVPNGVDVDATEFVSGAERRARRAQWLTSLRNGGWHTTASDVAVFMGSGHPPNVEAAGAVLRAAARMPDVLFVLVGSHVNELQAVPTGRNVIARGIVDAEEMHLLLTMCSVALNPMRTGSGTNIKMLDYFAAGAPTVSTLVGARGLGAVHDVHVILADDTADGLVDGIGLIRAQPARADRLARAARDLAQPYDWQVLGERFRAQLDRVTSHNRGGGAGAGGRNG
jgi:glycosyltransferase involved in cell wall biosynthesis